MGVSRRIDKLLAVALRTKNPVVPEGKAIITGAGAGEFARRIGSVVLGVSEICLELMYEISRLFWESG